MNTFLNKPSLLIYYLINVQFDELKKRWSHIIAVNELLILTELRNIITRNWERTLECSLDSIDLLGYEYLLNLINKKANLYKSIDSDKEWSNKDLIRARDICLEISKVSGICRFIIPSSELNRINSLSRLLRLSVKRAFQFESVIRKRIATKPFPVLTAAYLSFGSQEVADYLKKVIENTTRGLYLPNEERAAYQKIESKTETEITLNEFMDDCIWEAWQKVLKKNTFEEALLGESDDVMYIPNAVLQDFKSKLKTESKKIHPKENISITNNQLDDQPREHHISNEMVEYYIKDPDEESIKREVKKHITNELQNWADVQPEQSRLARQVVEYIIVKLNDPPMDSDEVFNRTKMAKSLNTDKKSILRVFNKIKKDLPILKALI